MTHTPHDLAEEFPHAAARIRELRQSNAHFARLADEYHDVNRAVHRAETRVETLGEAAEADGEDADLGDIFEDKRTSLPDLNVEQKENHAIIARLLESIDERDARVLRLRFGLEGREPLTLKEIGEEVGLTRERVRQIEVEALKKLQQQLNDDRPTRFYRENQPTDVPERRRPGRKRKPAPGQ